MSATRRPFSGLAALRRDEALRPLVELAHPIPDLECGESRAGLELSILPDGDTKVPSDLADPQTARLRSRSNMREHRNGRPGKWGGGTAPRPCAPRFPRQPHETRAVRECDGVLVLRMFSSYRRMSSQKEMMTNGVRISTATHSKRRALLFSEVVNR